MKYPHMLFLILFLFSIPSCDSAPPPSTAGVCQAQLYFADINTQGKLVTHGNSLIFIDDQPQAGSSDTFSIDASAVSGKNQQPTTVSIYTYGMIRYRAREERHVTFRFTYGNCNLIQQWPYGSSQPPSLPQKKQPPTSPKSCHPPVEMWAKHRRFMHGDPRGSLIIRGGRIWFGSRARTQYEWDFRDIKDIRQDGPYVLRITPVEGGEFTFDLLDRGISTGLFDNIKDCILR